MRIKTIALLFMLAFCAFAVRYIDFQRESEAVMTSGNSKTECYASITLEDIANDIYDKTGNK